MNNLLISVIVPVYNAEKYLSKCLDSIISQTYENWECIIVNDASPDGVGEIISSYAQRDQRFVRQGLKTHAGNMLFMLILTIL